MCFTLSLLLVWVLHDNKQTNFKKFNLSAKPLIESNRFQVLEDHEIHESYKLENQEGTQT